MTDERHKSLEFIERITSALGSIPAIGASVGIVVIWAVIGLITGIFASDWYQLIINTTTTIVTFLMVFVIQNSQNRDSRALQVKMDELIRALAEANDDFVGIERLPEKQIKAMQKKDNPRAS